MYRNVFASHNITYQWKALNVFGKILLSNILSVVCAFYIFTLRIIKLNLLPVPVRLHSGSGKFKFHRYTRITIFCDI